MYANSKKCTFLYTQVQFLGFVISIDGVSADPEKVRAIEEWPKPKTIHDARSFHGLAAFYRRLIKEFIIVMALITDYLKKGEFTWSNVASKVFIEIQKGMASAHVMRLLEFFKVFEVTCNTLGIGISGVLTQKDHPVTYFSEMQNDARPRHSTFDRELYVVIQALHHWRHYLLVQEFILYPTMRPCSISTPKRS